MKQQEEEKKTVSELDRGGMMGESSTCLMHAFSYASGTPNEAKEGNPIHALGESISFGRFMSDSLSWERWSTFPHNRYVEEAEKYSKPGSVAEKKAFFEAHYKRIAAQKAAAAAAAALLKQPIAVVNHNPEPESEARVQNTASHYSHTKNSKSQDNVDQQHDAKKPETNAGLDVDATGCSSSVTKDELEVHLANIELSSGKSELEKPLMKEALEVTSKKKSAIRATKLPCSPAAKHKASTVTYPWQKNNATPISTDAAIDSSDKKRLIPKSSHMSTTTPAREPHKLTFGNIKSTSIAASSTKTFRDCPTPLRTPITTYVPKFSSETPQSETRRTTTPVHPTASRSKTAGPKWRFLAMDCSKTLSACRKKSHSPIITSPFRLRTDERAARRKQNLEEKFNEKEAQKVQLQSTLKEKAESEIKRLRQGLCFKARPLPDFYKERKTAKNQNQNQKSPLIQPQSPKPGKKPSPSTKQVTSLPPQRPVRTKSNSNHRLPEKTCQRQIRTHTSLAEMIMHENTSPNIQL